MEYSARFRKFRRQVAASGRSILRHAGNFTDRLCDFLGGMDGGMEGNGARKQQAEGLCVSGIKTLRAPTEELNLDADSSV